MMTVSDIRPSAPDGGDFYDVLHACSQSLIDQIRSSRGTSPDQDSFFPNCTVLHEFKPSKGELAHREWPQAFEAGFHFKEATRIRLGARVASVGEFSPRPDDS